MACRVVVRPISSVAVFVPVRVATVTTATAAAVSTAAAAVTASVGRHDVRVCCRDWRQGGTDRVRERVSKSGDYEKILVAVERL